MNGPCIRKALPYAIIVSLAIVCYANSFRNEFVWDDSYHIVQNRFLRSGVFVPRFFTTDMAEAYGSPGEPVPNYRPVWMLSLLVDFQFWGLRPFGFHLTNLAFHIAAALLLFTLLRMLQIRTELALLTSALFVCHPVHTEAVTYISPRSTGMSAMFMLASLLLFLKFAAEDARRSANRWACFAASLTAFALALLSKENAVTFPLVIGAACWLVPAARTLTVRRRAFLIGAFGLVLAAYFAARAAALTATAYVAGDPLMTRCVLALRTLAATVGLSAVPFNLHVDRLLPTTGWQAQALTAAGAVTLIGLVLLCVWLYRRDGRVVLGIALFAIAFSLTSNLVPTNTTFAERWLYWPMAGLLVAAASGIEFAGGRFPFARRTALMAGWIAVPALAWATIKQNRVWHDEVSLYETAIARGADTVRVRANLAWNYLPTGKVDRARQLIMEAMESNPRHVVALWAMGSFQMEQKNYAGAKQWFERALQIEPTHTLSSAGLALAQEKLGELQRAEHTWRAVASASRLPMGSLRLAHFYLRHGRLSEAEQILREILQRDPQHAAAHNYLGVALFRQGQLDEAETHFKQALRYDRWLMDAHANLAAVAAERGDLGRALQHYDAALGIAPRNAELLYSLALTLQDFGHTQDARHALQRALAIDPQLESAKQMLEKLAAPAEK